ncbi:MAG TPA: winged helix-turn-helix transcriptional regulator [Streptosporangiaceae bacterium]|jgi:DNA-binding HxlR family transcriptional regulator|nr:winged helix-turn-helix transcriptional regulator [Streptosporangiaceae bacterium]
MPRRSYAHYCAIARSLDVLGERWTLLIIRELLAGPRRYTELHADLPGISTDILATRLKEMEADGLLERHRTGPPAPAWVYELTPRGRDLLPILHALAGWGTELLDGREPTDAVRSHWLALPIARLLRQAFPGHEGIIEVRVDGARWYLQLGPGEPVPAYEGPAEPGVVLTLSTETMVDLVGAQITLAEALAGGHLKVQGSSLVDALRATRPRHTPPPDNTFPAPAAAAGNLAHHSRRFAT